MKNCLFSSNLVHFVFGNSGLVGEVKLP